MLSFMRTCYFWLSFVVITFVMFCYLMIDQLKFLITKQVYPSERAHHIATLWGRSLFKAFPGWKVTIEGREYLPKTGDKCVIVANHASAIDILLLYFLGIPFRWLSKKEAFNIPGVGAGMRLAGYVPISRGDKMSHVRALEASADWIKKGVPMLFFPEGTRSVSGVPQSFKSGAFKLAVDTNAYLLPIVLHGAQQLMKKGSYSPSPASVLIRILPPVWPKEGQSVAELTEEVQNIVLKEYTQNINFHR